MNTTSDLLRPLVALVVGVFLVAGTTACDALLDVNNPGDVTEEGLQGEAALPVIVDGAFGDLQEAYDGMVLQSALFTDELVHSGSFPSFDQIDRRDIPLSNAEIDDQWEDISVARFAADNAAATVREVLGADAETNGMLAISLAFGGYARVLMADQFCRITLDVGPPLTPEEIYRQAEERFTEAMTVARAANADSTLNLALVGRARARLNLGDLGGAAADAEQVPPDFEFLVEYDPNSAREESEVFAFTIDRNETSIDAPFRNDPEIPQCSEHPSAAGFVEPCPFTTNGAFGPDNETPLFVQLKYPEDGSDIRLASGVEADLIAREARGEDVAGERARELWLEAHRLPDMRRRNDPFLAGGDSCIPLPDDEVDANPNL